MKNNIAQYTQLMTFQFCGFLFVIIDKAEAKDVLMI